MNFTFFGIISFYILEVIMKNKAITSRDEDFAQWYTDVVKAAKLADYTSVKGCIAIEPMITMGDRKIWLMQDKWSVCTRDKKPAAQYRR